MSGFAVLGFDKDPTFRFSAMLQAFEEFGDLSMKMGVIKHPTLIGEKVVCVRVQDFGAVFTPDEVRRLAKTVKRVDSMPLKARQFTRQLEGAADDAMFAKESANKAMI